MRRDSVTTQANITAAHATGMTPPSFQLVSSTTGSLNHARYPQNPQQNVRRYITYFKTGDEFIMWVLGGWSKTWRQMPKQGFKLFQEQIQLQTEEIRKKGFSYMSPTRYSHSS